MNWITPDVVLSRIWVEGVGATRTGYTTMVADTHQQLACSAYASPFTTRWIRNCNGLYAPVRSWPVRNLDSGFAEVGGSGCWCYGGNVVLDVEQYRNGIEGGMENILTCPCRIKKATEKAMDASKSPIGCMHMSHRFVLACISRAPLQ
jgi:hypothetical protein